MKRALALVLTVAAIACGGPGAEAPKRATPDLAAPLAAAIRDEAKGTPRADRAYLALLELAVVSPDSPWQVAAIAAALDALVDRSATAFAEATPRAALAFRTPDGDAIRAGLEAARAKAEGPFAAGLVARSLQSLAEYRGDAQAAERWRREASCAREAVVIGPLAWAPVTGVREPDALDAYDAKLEASYTPPGAFAVAQAPVVTRGRGCTIELTASSAVAGVRDVVVDVVVPSAQTIGLSLRAGSAAVLRAGGRVVLERAYELGGNDVTSVARVASEAGRLRVVARVGMTQEDDAIEIAAWDARGRPLAIVAPAVGSAGQAHANRVDVARPPAPRTDDERTAVAAWALAAGDARTAERTLANATARPDTPLEQLVLYARAIDAARDLSSVQRAERMRTAYDRVLDGWPSSWEAILGHALLAGVRRGQGEARIETLRDLDAHRAKAGAAAPVLDAFDALTSGRERLRDRAAASFARAEGALKGAPLLADVAPYVESRVGAERVAFVCAEAPPHARDTLDCYDAIRATGDRAAAARELARLRGVLGAPNRYLAISLREALAAGDDAAAHAAFDAMNPGERTLVALFALDHGGAPEKTRDRLRALAQVARDAPTVMPSLLRALGDDPLAELDGVAERIVAADRTDRILPTAATAILAHKEVYEVEPSGLTHYVFFDVRRVSGTTDVDQNAQADAPDVAGRGIARALRRRIFKKDGRVLEPDSSARGAQSHADLSQLEANDAVEAVYEGWVLPGETGDIGIDTPDLLPDRVAVHEATIELRLPEKLAGSLVAHALLGKAAETKSGSTRVLRWSLRDRPVRRYEYGVPRMDRTVGVSFATARWPEVGHALRETIASLDEHDPEILAWAKDAAKGQAAPRAIVAAVVEAAGRSVREAQPAMLSDFGTGRASGPQSTTARSILTEHEGSRSWVIVRALRELNIAAEIAVAEDQPFSSDPSFPPHFGRFTHPLVVARVPIADPPGPSRDVPTYEYVWIDADVSGPPLPAGRISPELRGRSMIKADGTIVPVPMLGGDAERDEIDIRLALDEKGDAKGSFTILLRGRDAQEIAEALYRIVGAERQKALRGVVLGWVPAANVDEVALSSTEGSWQIGVRAEISVSGYAQQQGKTWVLPGIEPLHYVFPRAYTASLGPTYAGQGARENALAVNFATLYHVHRRVDLPKGATVARMPSPFEVKSKHLEASRRFSVNASVLEDDLVLGIPTGTVAADEYGAFVADALKTDGAFLASTWVKTAP